MYKKNHETFTEIYERYATVILKYVVAQMNDVELGREICQQTFLAYYRNMEKIEPGMEKPWLLKTAKNFVIDYWRKASTRRELLTDDTETDFMDARPAKDMEKNCTDRMLVEEILQDLKKENILWYELVAALYLQQMDQKEAAEHLGISPGVLRARLYRLKRYLQKKYGEECIRTQ